MLNTETAKNKTQEWVIKFERLDTFLRFRSLWPGSGLDRYHPLEYL